MPQGQKISFVVFPDGEIDQASLTISGERVARQQCIASWLPDRYFGNSVTGYIADTVWREMQDKGFKSYTIRMDKDGKPVAEHE
jgi:hypothetical protein